MTPIQQIALRAPLDLRGQTLALYNIERVRGYLETHLGCKHKEVQRALNLSSHTVTKAIKTIRGDA